MGVVACVVAEGVIGRVVAGVAGLTNRVVVGISIVVSIGVDGWYGWTPLFGDSPVAAEQAGSKIEIVSTMAISSVIFLMYFPTNIFP